MVEVIYPFKQGRYPFGRGKQGNQTYMEYMLKANDQQEVNKYRQLNGIIKKLHHPSIMHLQRVLKQETTFHMIYEFHNKSLEQRLKELTDEEQLIGLFVELQNVFDCLIEKGLKAQLYLQFMGVDDNSKLKVWIKPDQLQCFQFTGNESKKFKKQLIEYYDTERTRIHLQIEEIFQNSQNNLSKRHLKNKEKQIKNVQEVQHSNKPKIPNFVIEGNTLVFLNTSTKSSKQDSSFQSGSEQHHMNKANHLVFQQRPISKAQMPTTKTSSQSEYQPDISKMSVAQKVLYYKKLKQQQNNDSNHLIVKDSSTSNASQHDLSKSSNNDSNLQIKTEMVNKNKFKITTSQEVQVEGNSDDDLQKLAREKIAKINIDKQKGRTHDTSTQNPNKSNTSGHSEKIQKYLKGLDEHSRQENSQKNEDHSKQINNKIAQAKLKAKNILEKYCQRLKK